jgi:hypothetical protein
MNFLSTMISPGTVGGVCPWPAIRMPRLRTILEIRGRKVGSGQLIVARKTSGQKAFLRLEPENSFQDVPYRPVARSDIAMSKTGILPA